MKIMNRLSGAMIVIIISIAVLFLAVNPEEVAGKAGGFGYLDHSTNRTLVPIRFVSESLGAVVSWDKDTKTVKIEDADTSVKLRIGSKQAIINNATVKIEVAPEIKQGTTYVPLRFVNDALGYVTTWDGERYTAIVENEQASVEIVVDQSRAPIKYSGTVTTSNGNIQATYRIIDLTDRDLAIDIGLAQGRVGATESLAKIARSNGAQMAINGTFFDAYSANNDPYGVLKKAGKLIHLGRGKTTIGFTAQQEVVMDVLSPKVSGSTNGSNDWNNNWYVTWINREASDASNQAILYTSDYGKQITYSNGLHVVVKNGVVTALSSGTTQIPSNGYILYFSGASEKQFSDRFEIGTKVDYTIEHQSERTSESEWQEVITAVGAGPRLVRNGQVDVGIKAESFVDPSITSKKAARSAIGVTNDRRLILLTSRGATINQLASAMKKIGAQDAMNLDGGASSGLYENGSYLTSPGRELSNVLLFK